MVRRIVLGDAARDDHALTDMLADLRASGNWSLMGRRRPVLRERFLRQLQGHLDRAERGSLAELLAQVASSDETRPTEQVPQWLFPTTPAILRDTTRATEWDTGTLAAEAGVLVFAPYFHRDDRTQVNADTFSPIAWLDDEGEVSGLGRVDDDWPFMPFSAGPAICPGRHLVLLTVSTVLGALLRDLDLAPVPDPLDTTQLPSALSPFSLEFAAA